MSSHGIKQGHAIHTYVQWSENFFLIHSIPIPENLIIDQLPGAFSVSSTIARLQIMDEIFHSLITLDKSVNV